MWFNIYDKDGNKVGEIVDVRVEAWRYFFLFLLLLPALSIAFYVAPLWASYEMGKGTWSRRRTLIKIVSGFFLGFWIVFLSLFTIGNAIDGIIRAGLLQTLIATVIGALGFGILALPYYMGKARRKSERTTSKTSTANRWLGR